MRLNLLEWPNDANYIAIKIDDFFLGYREIGDEELQISDIDFDESKSISLAYMDVDGTVGEWRLVELESLKLDAEDAHEWHAPKTGVDIINENDVATYLLIVLVAALLMFLVEWRLT